MKHSALSSLSVLSLFIGTLTLAGCSGTFSMPDTSIGASSSSVSGPAVQGTVFGGHSPIQGAHVYLLQPGTTGYGSAATSILNNNASASNATPSGGVGSPLVDNSNGYPLKLSTGADGSFTNNAYYVVTDGSGAFNLTGYYSCVAGQPVYIYAYGGNIGGTGAVNNNSIVQLATLGNCPSNGNTNFGPGSSAAISYIYLNEVSTVATAYTFQPFTLLTNNNAWDIGIPNPANDPLALTGIFNAAATAAQLYDLNGTQGSSSPSDGEGHVANTQTMGVSSPNTGNGIVPQATIDTLANILAYCVDSTPTAVGVTTAQCNSLFNIATDNGIAGGTPPVDTATAAINIARFPAGNNSSTGVNTHYASQLWNLTSSGTVPYLPALTQAAPNDWTIAIDYPSSAVDGLPSFPTGTMGNTESIAVDGKGQIWVTGQASQAVDQFTPLGALNLYNKTTPGYIWGYIAIDSNDNAWFGNAQIGPDNNTNPGQGTLTYNGVAGTPIDNISANATGAATLSTSPEIDFEEAYILLPDGVGNIYAFGATGGGGITASTGTDANDGGYPWYEMFELNSSGAIISSSTATCNGVANPKWYCISSGAGSSSINGGSYVAHGAISYYNTANPGTPSATPYFWLTTEQSTTANDPDYGTTENYQIAYVNSTGGKQFSFTTNGLNPEYPAVDNNGVAWIPTGSSTGNNPEIYKVTPTGIAAILANGGGGTGNTGANLNWPFGAAVDGNGNVWITDRGNNTLIELNGTGSLGTAPTGSVATPGTINTAISPPTNYNPETQLAAGAYSTYFNRPLNIAIDESGNVWITNNGSGGFVEVVGAAAPTYAPLSKAAYNGKLGAKP